ncbi:phosphoethanolamine N-methyltransferase-like [Acanthaster planci]|uniref:phosphoethanolamine N-methyltransferase n=1 Tax=Acanthaster planci TaxID=133434 RepID=A0A8B7YWG5_ACAPL|nr:phosphoethanolamine N-methyltransferase-like [Acanthaster planci]
MSDELNGSSSPKNSNGDDARSQMKHFWHDHSKDATLEEMMLDTQARTLCAEEQPEILSLLPSLAGKRILELGAGIGRFTGLLAESAKHVTAIDFMETFINKNRELNSCHDNIKFLQADATKLDFAPESFDVIFSNWLMMYLTDDEVVKLASKSLCWLDQDGFLFFRESCFHQSGNKKRDFNPTIYRKPALYNAIFQGTTQADPTLNNTERISMGFDLIFSRSVQSYIKLKNNQNQFCWLMQKVKRNTAVNHGFETFQQFLDSQQYTRQGILRYEKIFGDGYVSTGGSQTTKEFLPMIGLKPGQRVLDVGAGIGGGDFYMAKTYGVEVVGMDLSSNMIEIAMERASEHKDLKVQFEIADVTKRDYEAKSFDVVYSRDTLLHISDKASLFHKFLTWLKPGGKLLISDYCCGDLPHTDAFRSYIAQRGYTLYTPKAYGKLLEAAGFINVKAEDRTEQFMEILEAEKAKVEKGREAFIKEFSEEDFQYLVDGWTNKLTRSKAGDQKWGLFLAEKAAVSPPPFPQGGCSNGHL